MCLKNSSKSRNKRYWRQKKPRRLLQQLHRLRNSKENPLHRARKLWTLSDKGKEATEVITLEDVEAVASNQDVQLVLGRHHHVAEDHLLDNLLHAAIAILTYLGVLAVEVGEVTVVAAQPHDLSHHHDLGRLHGKPDAIARQVADLGHHHASRGRLNHLGGMAPRRPRQRMVEDQVLRGEDVLDPRPLIHAHHLPDLEAIEDVDIRLVEVPPHAGIESSSSSGDVDRLLRRATIQETGDMEVELVETGETGAHHHLLMITEAEDVLT